MNPIKLTTIVMMVFAVANSSNAGTKNVDLRNASFAEANAYLVVFCARGGSATGHAFVAWGVEDEEKVVSRQDAYGFYPERNAGVFGYVPGEVRNEAFNPKSALITDRLIVRVTKAQFEETLRIYPMWQTRDYNLFTTNCVAFAAAVARSLGLTVPDHTSFRFPSDFITTLIRKN